MSENITANPNTSKRPIIMYVFFVWVIVALISMYLSITLVQISPQARIVRNFTELAKTDPGASIIAERAMKEYQAQLTSTYTRTILEGLGLLFASVLIFINNKLGIILGFMSILIGLLFDFVNPAVNILIVNLIGLLIMYVLYRKTKSQTNSL